MRKCLPGAAMLLCLLAAGLLPASASAWGEEGHEIVGRVADKFLSSKARAAINVLLQDNQFQSLSDGRLTNWADSIRGSGLYRHKFPEMAKWHFIDIDYTLDPTPKELDEKFGSQECVLKATKKFQGILQNPAASIGDRREALFFIAHLIGDMHQPLHCSERNADKGGNLVRVRSEADDHHLTNLHKVWDTDLVREAIGPMTVADYSDRLSKSLSLEKRKEYQQGTIEDWILQSHKLAIDNGYKDKGKPLGEDQITLSSDYMLTGAEIVELQLTRGGVRLAQFLNVTLSGD